ncbi:MAG: isoprenylcysteine carboxyl methyltransferase family protein [Actinomycetota bacterium]
MSPVHALLLAMVAVRIAELAWARANTRRLLAEGAVEAGRGHYPVMVGLHGAWIAAMAAWIPPGAPMLPEPLALLGGLAVLRLWVLASLGRRWTTRILAVPGETLVRRGPYRWLRHPNYLVVAGEIAVAPLVFGAAELAVLFSALNGAMLAHRVAVEEAALGCVPPISARGSSAAAG